MAANPQPAPMPAAPSPGDSISPDQLPAFQDDPLREMELAKYDPDWNRVKVCRFCGKCRQSIASHLLGVHHSELRRLLSEYFPEIASKESLSNRELLLGYRRKFGYSKNEGLVCEATRTRQSEARKLVNVNRRRQRRPPLLKPTKKSQRKAQKAAAVKAQIAFGCSVASRKRLAITSTGTARRTLWKVTDWTLARWRLDGLAVREIASRAGMFHGSVKGRLDRIGFPRHGRVFYRGEALTLEHLRVHFRELRYVRVLRELKFRVVRNGYTEESELTSQALAILLEAPLSWVHDRSRKSGRRTQRIPLIPCRKKGRQKIYRLSEIQAWLCLPGNRLSHGIGAQHSFALRKVEEELGKRLQVSQGHLSKLLRGGYRRPASLPLSGHLPTQLISSIVALRQEWKKLGSTARGGNPRALLPSEEQELFGKYQGLKSDLELLFTWAEKQADVITLDMVGAWLCQQSRHKNLRVLLFWPTIHSKLPAMCEGVRNRVRGGLGVAERTKELLCGEYEISQRTLEGLLSPDKSAKMALPAQ